MIISNENVRVLQDLKFGTRLQIRWHAVGIHDEGDADCGIVFGGRVGYSDGTDDKLRDIARCVELGECCVELDSVRYENAQQFHNLHKEENIDTIVFKSNCKQIIEGALGLHRIPVEETEYLGSFVDCVCHKNLHEYVNEYYNQYYKNALPVYYDTMRDFVFSVLGCNYKEACSFALDFECRHP